MNVPADSIFLAEGVIGGAGPDCSVNELFAELQKVQKIIGRPSTKTFLSIVDKHLLPNYPVTRDDIIAAESIFGPDVGSLKGKTVRKASPPVKPEYTNIPATIMSRYQKVTVAGDIMFVNKPLFFVTILRHIRFSTSKFLKNKKSDTIFLAIKHVYQTYLKRGFKLKTLMLDGEFGKDGLHGEVAGLGCNFNAVTREEHVPQVERNIRTIKDRSRSVVSMLPFKLIPARIIIKLIRYCVFWLNSLPAKMESQMFSVREQLWSEQRLTITTTAKLSSGHMYRHMNNTTTP